MKKVRVEKISFNPDFFRFYQLIIRLVRLHPLGKRQHKYRSQCKHLDQ